jgi:hypothetical protein
VSSNLSMGRLPGLAAVLLAAGVMIAMESSSHPCRPLKQACREAGFVKGGHATGKGLYKDCMMPVLSGQTVAWVSVPPAEIESCKAQRSARH